MQQDVKLLQRISVLVPIHVSVRSSNSPRESPSPRASMGIPDLTDTLAEGSGVFSLKCLDLLQEPTAQIGAFFFHPSLANAASLPRTDSASASGLPSV